MPHGALVLLKDMANVPANNKYNLMSTFHLIPNMYTFGLEQELLVLPYFLYVLL